MSDLKTLKQFLFFISECFLIAFSYEKPYVCKDLKEKGSPYIYKTWKGLFRTQKEGRSLSRHSYGCNRSFTSLL